MNRKQFIASAGRLVILSVMTALVAMFASRKQVGTVETCGLSGACKQCGKLKNCSLPGAEKERNHG